MPSRSPLRGVFISRLENFSHASSQLGLDFLLLFELVRVKDMKQGDRKRSVEHCDPDRSRTVCVCVSLSATGGAAVQLYEHCVCSISFERLVRSGDDFLSAVGFITSLLLQRDLCFDN